MNKKVLAGVLSLMLLLPITGEARRHTYWGLTGATNGFDPRAHSYSIRKSHRPSWIDHAMQAWEHFVGGAFPGHDPSILADFIFKNNQERERLLKQLVWERIQGEILKTQQKENERLDKTKGTEIVAEKEKSDEILRKAEANSSIKPKHERIEEGEGTGPQLIERDMGNGGFQKWKENNRKKLGERYNDAAELTKTYLAEIERLEGKIKDLAPNEKDSQMVAKNKKLQIKLYQMQIEEIRRKIKGVTNTIDIVSKTYDKQMEDAEAKENTRESSKFAIFDPYNPTEKEIENGATRPDVNKKLPTPF